MGVPAIMLSITSSGAQGYPTCLAEFFQDSNTHAETMAITLLAQQVSPVLTGPAAPLA